MNNLPPDPKYLNIPNICFSITEPGDKREEEFSLQRRTRGFDNSETWALDQTIVDFILPRLKVFKELTVGFPVKFDTMQEWQDVLDQMIEAFELMHLRDHYAEDVDDMKINRGLDLFREYFFHLWW